MRVKLALAMRTTAASAVLEHRFERDDASPQEWSGPSDRSASEDV